MKITNEMLEIRNRCLTLVSGKTGVPVDDILSRKRTAKVASARMLVVWALYVLYEYSTPAIGTMMGRSPATILHMVAQGNGSSYLTTNERMVMEELKKMKLEGGVKHGLL